MIRVIRQRKRYRKFFIVLLGFLFLVLHGVSPAQSDETSANIRNGGQYELSFRRTDLNVLVTVDELSEALAESSVLATLPKDYTLSFYNAYFKTLVPSVLLLRANTEVLVAAVLLGEIQAKGKSAEPGEAIVWPVGGKSIEVVTFDAEKFLEKSQLNLRPEVIASLVSAVGQQERLKFWGLLEQVDLGLFSPFETGDRTSANRQYLENPLVVSFIRQYPDTEELGKAVAEAFVDALRTGELETVEWLISPQLFVNDRGQLNSSEWIELRQDFAFLIMIEYWESLQNEVTLKSTSNDSGWLVTAATYRYHLWLEPLDGMIFVTGFEPIKE